MPKTSANKYKLKFALLAASIGWICVTAPVSANDCQRPSIEDIAALTERWNTAAATGHPDKITRLYAKDADFVAANGLAARVGYDAIRDYFVYTLQGQPQLQILTRTIQTACDMAIDRGVLILSTGPKGAREAEKQNYTLIYSRRGETWQIDHHHVSSVRDDQSVPRPAKPSRAPAVAGFIYRVPEKPKPPVRARPARTTAVPIAVPADDYRAGAWDQGTPVFEN
jgi:uncharacterized protein (TIGR02246 family)